MPQWTLAVISYAGHGTAANESHVPCSGYHDARRRALRYARATAAHLKLHMRIDVGNRCHVYDPETGEIAVSYIPTRNGE